METTMNYIEVIGVARVFLPVELYRVRLVITARASRKRRAIEQSFALCRKVIEVLEQTGVAREHIQEAGGGLERPYWNSSKAAKHTLVALAKDEGKLMSAVSRLETEISKRRHTFLCSILPPIFSLDEAAVKEARKQAMANAKEIALSYAQEAGLQLGSVIQIEDLPAFEKAKSEPFYDTEGVNGLMAPVRMSLATTRFEEIGFCRITKGGQMQGPICY